MQLGVPELLIILVIIIVKIQTLYRWPKGCLFSELFWVFL
jgi:hypothetical protein